jgi:hypothetical protein
MFTAFGWCCSRHYYSFWIYKCYVLTVKITFISDGRNVSPPKSTTFKNFYTWQNNLKNFLDFISFSFVAEFHSNKFSEFNRACCSNISLYLTKYCFTWAQFTTSFLCSRKHINQFIMLYGVIFWSKSTRDNKESVYTDKCWSHVEIYLWNLLSLLSFSLGNTEKMFRTNSEIRATFVT